MSSKNRILLDFNASGNNKIKHLAIHPRKDFIGIVNSTNNYALWNFKQKILIKSFSCSSLDDSKQVDIKQSIFYDRYSLPTKFQGGINMRNNIIFVTPQRIFLYDYVTDVIKSINEKQLQQKNIRKVAIYSENKICIVLNDGSFKVLDIRGLYSKQEQPQATIRTFKGYHTKPITWIFAYSQNINQMPRVITVSSSDGLMACWNVDSLLQSTSGGGFGNKTAGGSGISMNNTMTPCFKFIMSKGTKNDSNNGQQIVSLQYDPSSYHLVTLTQSYITIWSTMTGMQLKRVKNTTLKLKEIVFFNHFSFGSSSFIGHSHASTLYIFRNLEGGAQIQDEINLKQFVQDNQLQILSIKNIPQYPANLFIITTTDLLVLQIDKFYRSSFGFHPSFITKLTTFNSRHFIKKGQGQFKKPITAKQLSKIQFPDDILFNTFYLSYDCSWIYFHLVELQYKNMLHQSHKYKLQKIPPHSLFNTYAQSSRTQISVSFDGKDIILFNKTHSYFEIYSIDRQLLSANDRDLIGADEGEYDEQGLFSNGINFYTSLALIYSGICRNIAWHQYKSQFSAICGLDKNGILVNYVTQKQKKPLFGKSSSKVQPKKTGEIKSWHVCLFQKVSKKDSPSEYQIILTSPPIQTKIYSLFSTGQQFAYSITQKSAETGNEIQRLQFMSSKGITKQVQGIVVTPQKIYTSYCQTFHIYCYEGYFIIFRVQQNGCLSYYRSIQETIFQGLFWQKLFFFATKSGIYFLQILNQTICIRIACNSPQKESKQSNDVFQNTKVRSNQQWDENGMKQLYEDLQQQCHLTPDGQLQMIGVVNMNLLLVNQIGRQHFLDLKAFPYIEFCMQISSGYLQKAGQIFKSSCGQIQQLMKQTLNSYGLILSSIM